MNKGWAFQYRDGGAADLFYNGEKIDAELVSISVSRDQIEVEPEPGDETKRHKLGDRHVKLTIHLKPNVDIERLP